MDRNAGLFSVTIRLEVADQCFRGIREEDVKFIDHILFQGHISWVFPEGFPVFLHPARIQAQAGKQGHNRFIHGLVIGRTEVILKLSVEAGSPKAVNVVLIGVLAKTTNIEKEVWLKVINETVPEKFLQLNLKAFELGYNY